MPTPDKLARRYRRATLESLRAHEDAEDFTDLLAESLAMRDWHFCAPCLAAGFTTRVDRRGRVCINHFRSVKARAA